MDNLKHPIAQFGSLSLYPDHVVQSTPAVYKTMALPGVEFCRWRRQRYTGMAVAGALLGSAAAMIAALTIGDGPMWTVPIWVGLACASFIMFAAYRRLDGGIMTIRGLFGCIIETRGPAPTGATSIAISFIDALMSARRAIEEDTAQRTMADPAAVSLEPIEGVI